MLLPHVFTGLLNTFDLTWRG